MAGYARVHSTYYLCASCETCHLLCNLFSPPGGCYQARGLYVPVIYLFLTIPVGPPIFSKSARPIYRIVMVGRTRMSAHDQSETDSSIPQRMLPWQSEVGFCAWVLLDAGG